MHCLSTKQFPQTQRKPTVGTSKQKEGSKIMRRVRARGQGQVSSTANQFLKNQCLVHLNGYNQQKVISDDEIPNIQSDSCSEYSQHRKKVFNKTATIKKGKDFKSCIERLMKDDIRRKEMRVKLAESKALSENSCREDSESKSRKRNKSLSLRTYQDFYLDQLRYKQTIEDKVSNYRFIKIEKEIREAKNAHVKVSERSQRLLEKINQQTGSHSRQRNDSLDAHDRLYQMKIKDHDGSQRRKNAIQQYQTNLQLHKRQISYGDQQKSVDRLYKESKEHDKRLKQIQDATFNRKAELQLQQKAVNTRLVFQKLCQDFKEYVDQDLFYNSIHSALQEAGTRETLQTGEKVREDNSKQRYCKKGTPLNLKAYIKLMHSLGFIHLKSSSPYEEELITDLWKALGGTNDNHIKAENLMMALAGLMNLQVSEILLPEEHIKESTNYFCYDEQRNLGFRDFDQVKKLQQKFVQLSFNRKQVVYAKDGSFINNQQFIPQISKHSKKLLENKTQKTLLDRLYQKKPYESKQSDPSRQSGLRPTQTTHNRIKNLKEYRSQEKLEQQRELVKSNTKEKLKEYEKTKKKVQSKFVIQNRTIQEEKQHSYDQQSPNRRKTLGNRIKTERNLLEEEPREQESGILKKQKSGSNLKTTNNYLDPNLIQHSNSRKNNMKSQQEENDSTPRIPISRINRSSYGNGSHLCQFELEDQQRSCKEELDQTSQKTHGTIHSHLSKIEGKQPLVFVDINIGKAQGTKRIMLFEGDDPSYIAQKFGEQFELSQTKISKLEAQLNIKVMEYKKKQVQVELTQCF